MTYDLKTRQDKTKKRGVSWVLAFGFTRFLSVIKSKNFTLLGIYNGGPRIWGWIWSEWWGSNVRWNRRC